MQGKILLCLSVLAAAVPLRAGDGALDRATLRGIKAVNVVVDPLNRQLEQTGLTQEMLRSKLEERLRQAGIAIDRNSNEFLGLRVDSVLARKGPYSICFALGFYQRVLLVRDQGIRTATQTWDVNTILVVMPKPMVDGALNTAEQLADQFVTAYRFVNPKP